MAKKVAEKNVAEEVKAVAVEEAVAAPAAEEKAEPKKRGRKPAAKTEEKKEAVKADKNQETVYVQFAGLEVAVDEIKNRAKAAYEAEGHRASSIKSLRLYIKPEEMKAYYVINDKAAGSIDL